MYPAVNTPAPFARQQPVSGRAFTAAATAFTKGPLATATAASVGVAAGIERTRHRVAAVPSACAGRLEGAPHERRLAAGDGH